MDLQIGLVLGFGILLGAAVVWIFLKVAVRRKPIKLDPGSSERFRE